MDIAILAPCPIPYMIGGVENLVRGLQDHINERTPHQAEIIKLPSPELNFPDLVDSYRRFSELDVTGFDLAVAVKYPAWMTPHPRLAVYMTHKLRGLYDTYHFTGLPERLPDPPASVRELSAFMADHSGRRDALGDLFERIDALRRAPRVTDKVFAFPGPVIREIVHFLDGVGLARGAVRRYGAVSATVRDRADYFPAGEDVFVVHHPTALAGLRDGRPGAYLFTASRLDPPKRIDLLVDAIRLLDRRVELRIAGGGPDEAALRERAGGDRRIVFCGRVPEAELVDLYAGARAVAFVPYAEDYGLITLEAMLSGKPVITCRDSGGCTELVADGENGFVVDPDPQALAAAIDRLWSSRRLARRMGREAKTRADQIGWQPLVDQLVAE
jgi:glycosyltransferase involved in cell wall biosynthesis